MFNPCTIDLHIHTTVSDGTDTPEELLVKVRDAGFTLFSVTDHDAIKGCLIIRSLKREGIPSFLSGAEFSCRDEKGMYHILGYGYDLDAESIHSLVKASHELRMKKVMARLDFLRSEFGFVFSQEDLQHLLAQDNPGKPHIANLMVQYGYAETKEQGIKEYINRIRFPHEFLHPEQAIRAILAAGGIPVLAHPSFGDGDQRILGEEMDERVRHLLDFGLQGLEAYYSGFTKDLSQEILSFADRYDLFVTAGSDYHGKNKPIALGSTGFDPSEPWPDGLCRFLEAASEKRICWNEMTN